MQNPFSPTTGSKTALKQYLLASATAHGKCVLRSRRLVLEGCIMLRIRTNGWSVAMGAREPMATLEALTDAQCFASWGQSQVCLGTDAQSRKLGERRG